MKLTMSVFFALAISVTAVHAEDPETRLTLSDLVAKGASRLSKSDLQSLLPGVKVESKGLGGSTKYWENSVDGKFTASTDTRGKTLTAKPSIGQGTWHIADEGAYCVRIEWKKHVEEWCRYVFKDGDQYYGVNSLDRQDTPAHELAFSK